MLCLVTDTEMGIRFFFTKKKNCWSNIYSTITQVPENSDMDGGEVLDQQFILASVKKIQYLWIRSGSEDIAKDFVLHTR